MVKLTTKFREQISHYVRVVAFAILGIAVGATVMTALLGLDKTNPYFRPLFSQEVPQLQISVAAPVRLRIPAVGIDAEFEEPLGLNDDNTIEVPKSYETLGWYKNAPLPGEIGPAVILGHVDSYEGPAVFFNLSQAKVGNIIEIDRLDGSVGKFEITKLLYRQQSDFPTEAVYGDIDHAGLRLITCTGTYDYGKQVYSHNLIVFAKLVE